MVFQKSEILKNVVSERWCADSSNYLNKVLFCRCLFSLFPPPLILPSIMMPMLPMLNQFLLNTYLNMSCSNTPRFRPLKLTMYISILDIVHYFIIFRFTAIKRLTPEVGLFFSVARMVRLTSTGIGLSTGTGSGL